MKQWEVALISGCLVLMGVGLYLIGLHFLCFYDVFISFIDSISIIFVLLYIYRIISIWLCFHWHMVQPNVAPPAAGRNNRFTSLPGKGLNNPVNRIKVLLRLWESNAPFWDDEAFFWRIFSVFRCPDLSLHYFILRADLNCWLDPLLDAFSSTQSLNQLKLFNLLWRNLMLLTPDSHRTFTRIGCSLFFGPQQDVFIYSML